MFLDEVCQVFGFSLRDLAAGFWPADPDARLREEAARLRRSLRRGYDRLVRRRRLIEGGRYRVEREQKRVACLSQQASEAHRAGANAGAYSLELEQARGRLDRIGAALDRQERAYQDGLEALCRTRRKLARLQEKLLFSR